MFRHDRTATGGPLVPASLVERALFNGSWLRFGRALRAGQGRVDLDVAVADGRLDRYLTLVGRLSPDVARVLAGAAAELGDGQNVYPPADLHVTVVDCSNYLPPGEIAEAIESVRVRLADGLRGSGPLVLRLDGFNVFPTTVCVQAWDDAGTMRRLRRRVRGAFGGRLSPRDRVSFANIVRFTSPPPPTIVEAVRPRRRASFGTVQIETLELALADKCLSSAGTTTLATFPLPAHRPSG